MDDLNLNIDDIINDVNSKIKSDEEPEKESSSDDIDQIAADSENKALEDNNSSIDDFTYSDEKGEKNNVSESAVKVLVEPVEDSEPDSKESKSVKSKGTEQLAEQIHGAKNPNKKSENKKKKKKKKSKINNSVFGGIILVTVILTVSLVLAIGGISIGMEYYGIGKTDEDIRFNIPAGSTNSEIADQLVKEGVIENKRLFMIALKIQKPKTIYPGDITLQPSSGYADIITELATMRESYKTVSITFTEGEDLLEIAKKLEENEVCTADDFLFEFNKNQGYDYENEIKDDGNMFYRMEGYFYPETYEFYVDDSAANVTKKIRDQFEKKYTESLKTKIEKSGMTLNEVMTLASIVQLEAASEEEMPTVASIFINRLNDQDTYPMLQSDTTSNYIKNVIKVEADNTASIEHYTESYDTYSCKGLPAGPICSPGMDAINAVLNPKKTDYYYFCNNLETGETFYAKTLEEHEKNLKKAGLS